MGVEPTTYTLATCNSTTELRPRKWSGMRESNSPHQLGRLRYYHYTNPALDDPLGFEPRQTEPKSVVLPLDEGSIPYKSISATRFSKICFYIVANHHVWIGVVSVSTYREQVANCYFPKKPSSYKVTDRNIIGLVKTNLGLIVVVKETSWEDSNLHFRVKGSVSYGYTTTYFSLVKMLSKQKSLLYTCFGYSTINFQRLFLCQKSWQLDLRRIELLTLECKSSVFPLALKAQNWIPKFRSVKHGAIITVRRQILLC